MHRPTIFALLLAAGTAAAQPALDADGDGAVTFTEFETARLARIRERFAALDANADGKLDEQELAARRSRLARRGQWLDTDGDGAWSFAELQARRPNLTAEAFNRLDVNGDGLIGADERRRRGR